MFQSFDMNLNLGKPTPSKTDEFSEKFQGGGDLLTGLFDHEIDTKFAT